jgi:glycerophosphoryl diester phosphodiesterase
MSTPPTPNRPVASNRPVIIAHRGASAAARENTLEAFALAADLGADWVELDVRLSADGAIVVLHDDRFADGRAVLETDAADRPDGVCLLEEALDVCDRAGLRVNVEIKAVPGEVDHHVAPTLTDATRELLDARYGGDDDRRSEILVTSFWPATLNRFHDNSDIATGLLTVSFDQPLDTVARTGKRGHVAVNPWDGLVDEAYMDAARQAGVMVNVWTVNDPDRMRQLARLGVDGIITDVPDVALAALS